MLQFEIVFGFVRENLKMARYVMIILSSVALVVSTLQAAPPSNSTALFNGQNLFGWTYHLETPDVKPGSVWSVKDGILHCTGQPAGYISRKRTTLRTTF